MGDFSWEVEGTIPQNVKKTTITYITYIDIPVKEAVSVQRLLRSFNFLD